MRLQACVKIDQVSEDGEAVTVVNKMSDSFVQNFMRALVCSFNGTALVAVVDTGGVGRSVSFAGTIPVAAMGGQAYFGAVIGSAGAATVGSEFALGSQIQHGSGSGTLMYSDVTITPTTVDGSNIEFAIRRSFVNLTESPQTVCELGIVARHSGYNILILRDVFDPIEIPPNGGVAASVVIRTVI
jgi:hypothetical protein